MTGEVIPLKGEPLKPLELMHGEHCDGEVILDFNRRLTPEEFEFFFETSMRTVHLMRGIELK